VKSVKDQGSLFWLEIPVSAVADIGPVHSESSRSISGYAGPRKTVLVVDDNVENRYLVLSILLPLGFRLIEAENGQACFEKVDQYRPDLILLDLRMPGMDGFDVASRLRQIQTPTYQPVIIAVSASAFEEDRQRSLQAGCHDFLAKPFRKDELLYVLQQDLHLQWTYADNAPAPAPPLPSDLRPLVDALPFQEWQQLMDGATRGGIKHLLHTVSHISALREERFAPLLVELETLTRQFQIDKIVELLELRDQTPQICEEDFL
jgi:CheY-like chemotaxis protein